ncbi:hypothetical protein PtB15_17B119 [Puccinia triticina]|nr:hypothetical protein PtB15_17B119 [Puccinia triticina]
MFSVATANVFSNPDVFGSLTPQERALVTDWPPSTPITPAILESINSVRTRALISFSCDLQSEILAATKTQIIEHANLFEVLNHSDHAFLHSNSKPVDVYERSIFELAQLESEVMDKVITNLGPAVLLDGNELFQAVNTELQQNIRVACLKDTILQSRVSKKQILVLLNHHNMIDPPRHKQYHCGAHATSGPVASTSGPAASTSEPKASASGPVASASGPVASASGPVASASSPVASASGPGLSTSGAVSGPAAPTLGTVHSPNEHIQDSGSSKTLSESESQAEPESKRSKI